MKLYKFSNHSLSLAYWLKNLSLSKTYYLLHIDKHSDLLSPKRSDNINSGNFLFHFFLTDINIKKMFWIYPDYFHKDENYQKLLSLEIKEIFNNISIYFKNANIKKLIFQLLFLLKKNKYIS